MKKQHGNTGRKNALKSGRTAAPLTIRMTPEVKKYMQSGETSPADKIEAWARAEIERGGL